MPDWSISHNFDRSFSKFSNIERRKKIIVLFTFTIGYHWFLSEVIPTTPFGFRTIRLSALLVTFHDSSRWRRYFLTYFLNRQFSIFNDLIMIVNSKKMKRYLRVNCNKSFFHLMIKRLDNIMFWYLIIMTKTWCIIPTTQLRVKINKFWNIGRM